LKKLFSRHAYILTEAVMILQIPDLMAASLSRQDIGGRAVKEDLVLKR